jgi:hypothetical protein
VDFLGLAALKWFFPLVQRFSTLLPKYLCYLLSTLYILVDWLITHTKKMSLYFSKNIGHIIYYIIEYGLRCVNEIITKKILNHKPCNL